MEEKTKKLHSTMDAKVWAEEFMETINRIGVEEIDEGLMIGRFANAIMVGYDAGLKINSESVKSEEQVDTSEDVVGKHTGEFDGRIEIKKGYRNNVCPNCDFHYINELSSYCSRCGREIKRVD